MRTALVIVISLIATACAATVPSPRLLEEGFAPAGGVADPYRDGKQHLAAGRYEVAVQRFGQVLASDGRSLEALNGLGIAYTRMGRFEVAQTYFERALQVDPSSVSTLNNYGWSLAERGRLREAKPFLELALRHAEQTDVPVVAGNIESIGRARPSALVTTQKLHEATEGEPDTRRLVQVDDNVYRLETGPSSGRHPAAHDSPQRPLQRLNSTVVSPDNPQSDTDGNVASTVATAARHAPASTRHFRAPEPDRDGPVESPFGGGSSRPWSDLVSNSNADPLSSGD